MKPPRLLPLRMRRCAALLAVVVAASSLSPFGALGKTPCPAFPLPFRALPCVSVAKNIPSLIAKGVGGPGIKPGPETRTVAITSGRMFFPLALSNGKPGALYSLSVAARNPNALRQRAVLNVSVRSGNTVLVSKWLHQADPDVYFVFRVDNPRAVTFLQFEGPVNGTAAAFHLTLQALPADQKAVVIEAEPNDTWQQAQPAPLGTTVIGTADDRSYLLAPDQNLAEALSAGEDWFQFEQPANRPKLVYFNLDILDRDVPANILVYTVQKGKLVPYTEGVDPVSGPHESQIAPTLKLNNVELNSANKFTTRVLKKGTYYVQVTANHPAYRLRTLVYDPPPYTAEGVKGRKGEGEGGNREQGTGNSQPQSPNAQRPTPERPFTPSPFHPFTPSQVRQAIRAGMDYIVAAGDSWFANTPRSGAVNRRDRQNHAETSLCVACHPSHFATRGELFAYRNGYPIVQRESLRFLAERLYNNPRPFYGPSGASWVRVIGAAATVQSRMAQMLSVYEAITGEYRPAFYAPILAYLQLYDKRATFQPDENEQNPPSISNFETGWMTWHAFDRIARKSGSKAALLAERDKVEQRMARTPEEANGPKTASAGASIGTEIKNVDDLCFQTIALADMHQEKAEGEKGRRGEGERPVSHPSSLIPHPSMPNAPFREQGKYAERIKANVEKIFAAQREDGLWPYSYGDKQPTCEFQTGEALYALAKAGVPNTDPRVQKAVAALLARQKPFGAWNTDGQPYEGFNTPFKETQLVLMGLSAMYPGPGARGWTNREQPTRIRTDRVDQTLADLIALWDRPSPTVLKQIRELARSREPLVRLEAINALCRLADVGAVPVLTTALGDDTNMVRRAAAQAFREMITRHNEPGANRLAVAALASAIQSPNLTVRRAALRAFNQHFRWLTQSAVLLNAVLAVAEKDADSVARMEAAQALSLWWYWNDDRRVRGRILDTILAALGDEKAGDYALEAFRETLYNICDEDIQYVYNFWTPLLPQETDRNAVLDGFKQVMALQATKIAAALRNATPFQARQIVLGLTEYPVARAWNPADQIERNFARIGNDLDAIDFRGPEAVTALRPVVLTLMLNSDPIVRQRALVLTSYLRSNGGQPYIANAIAARLDDSDSDVRALALQAHHVFPFSAQQAQFGLDPRRFTDENDRNDNEDTLPLLTRLLDSPHPETQVGALRFLSEFGKQIETDAPISAKAKILATTGSLEARAAAFEIARFLPALRSDAEFQSAVAEVLKTAPAAHAARLAALRLVLTNPLGHSEVVAPALEAILQSKRPEDQTDALALARSDPAIRDDARLLPLYDNALTSDGDLRGQALQLVKQSRALASNPAVRVALQAVAQSGSAGHKALAAAILSGNVGRRGDPEKLLDREFFAVKVQPLLAAKGPDGKSCFHCHSNHTILNLQPPDESGQFSAEITRSNYRSALRVIDLDDPEKSLLLRKPLSPGVVSPETGLSHVGGARWTGREHPAYQAILQWLNGARVKQGEALGKPPGN